MSEKSERMTQKVTASVQEAGQTADSMDRMMQVLRIEQKRKKADVDFACGKLMLGELPTTDDVKKILLKHVGQERQQILSRHIFWKEMKLRKGLEALIEAAASGHVDICRHIATVSALSNQNMDFANRVASTVSNLVQKDIMAFCAAAIGTIDVTRRIKKLRIDVADKIQAEIDRNFQNDVCAFIKDLRNNLSHGSVFIPNWSVTIDRASKIFGNLTFQSQDLLSFGEWSVKSKAYIGNGVIDIGDAVQEYFMLLKGFYAALNDIFSKNVTDAETDYYDITDEIIRSTGQSFMKILLPQIEAGKTPYDYLQRFCTPEEARAIRRLPDNTKEQVDYIISLWSVRIDCDLELRKKLYEVFAVENQIWLQNPSSVEEFR